MTPIMTAETETIPEDVRREAEKWGGAALTALTTGAKADVITKLFEGAILAERERATAIFEDCAAMCDAAGLHYATLQDDAKSKRKPKEARDFESMRIASVDLALAIRRLARTKTTTHKDPTP